MWVAAKLGSSVAHFLFMYYSSGAHRRCSRYRAYGLKVAKRERTCHLHVARTFLIEKEKNIYSTKGTSECVCVFACLWKLDMLSNTHTHAHPNTSKNSGHSCLAFWKLQGAERKQDEQGHTDLKCTLCLGNVNSATAEGVLHCSVLYVYSAIVSWKGQVI